MCIRDRYPDRAAFATRHPRGEGEATDDADWSYGRLKRVLAEVRTRGWADEDGEVTSGLASAGAAVVDHLGWPAAAIAVTFPDDAASELREQAIEGVREAAATLSRRIRGIR